MKYCDLVIGFLKLKMDLEYQKFFVMFELIKLYF